MSVETYAYAYVGRARCGHVFFVAVDDGAKSNAKDVAGVLRKGGTIERLTIAAAREAAKASWCTCTKKQRWAVSEAPR